MAGNYKDGTVDVYIDATLPNLFTPMANPSGWTNNTQPTISFSTTDATSGLNYYNVSIDGGAFTTQTSPYQFPSQTDGIHNITVRAYDNAENYLDRFVYVYIDTNNPDSFTPTANPSSWTNNTQPSISFFTTDATSSIDYYNVSIDGGPFSTRTSSYIIPPQTEGTHNVTVRAYDLAGNHIDGFVDIYIDITAPNGFVAVADPSTWTNNTQPQITFSTTDGLSGMDHYEVKIDSGGFTPQSSPYQLPPQTSGIHNITVRAYDNAGNYIDRYVDVYIDITVPNEFTPIADPSSWTNNSQPQITFSTTDGLSGMDHYGVKIDTGGFSTQTSPYTLPAQTEGSHNVTVRAYDSVGNYFDSYVDVYIDTIDPNDFIPTADPDTWTNNTQPMITFTTTDATSGLNYYNVSIDGGMFTTQTSPYQIPSQTDGIHNITVRAYDNAENYLDRFVYIYIDTNNPDSFTPTANPSDWTYNTQPVITYSTTDVTSSIDHYEISIDGGGFSTQTSPYTLPSQADGIHNITVRAFDLVGNYVDGYIDVYIDTTDPIDFEPTAPTGWIIDNQPDILFSTTDVTSGMDHYELRIDSSPFDMQTSPYTLPQQADGIHNITVRAYDRAGNYIDRYVEVNIDTTPPSVVHTPVTSGNKDVAITITAVVTDEQSGVDYVELFYKKEIDTKYTNITMIKTGGIYSAEIPANIVTIDGVDYYIKTADKTVSPFVVYYGSGGQVTQEPNVQNDIIITISDIDITPPIVSEKFPEGNNIPVSTPITVTFNEAMDTTIKDNIFQITPGLTGTTHWEGNKLIFTSEYALEYNTPYTVIVGTEAEDLAGNNLEIEVTWQFITTSIRDVTPPTISIRTPRGDDVSIDTTISITFSESMFRQDTENAFSIDPDVSGDSIWDGNELIFYPDSPLSYETEYTVTISTDAKDIVGNNLEQESYWSFTTVNDPEGPVGPETGEKSLWETWEPIITGLMILTSAFAFLIGFLSIRRKRGKLRLYLERIDDTFNEYKKEYQECESELVTLREDLKREVKRGKLEENHFLILDKKIDDYMREMKSMQKVGKETEKVKPE